MANLPNTGLVLLFASLTFGCSISPSDRGTSSTRDAIAGGADTAIGLNDLSVLWPLQAGLPGVSVAGEAVVEPGAMLSAAQLAVLPDLLDTVIPLERRSAHDLLPSLRVVSIRFDPCFLDVPHAGECQPQMRLVVQPMIGGVLRDAALHLFYRVSAEDLRATLQELMAARGPQPDAATAPLSVNPALARQGGDGPYATALRDALARHATPARLARLAFSALRERGNRWLFGSFDFDGDRATPVRIAGVSDETVMTFQMGVENNGFSACCTSFSPSPVGTDSVEALAAFATRSSLTRPSDLAEQLRKIDRIENPDVHGPGTVDCVSCHVAMASRYMAREKAGLDGHELAESPDRFLSAEPLSVVSPRSADITVVRAFGYAFDVPAISQRTINETAAIVESIRAAAR